MCLITQITSCASKKVDHILICVEIYNTMMGGLFHLLQWNEQKKLNKLCI